VTSASSCLFIVVTAGRGGSAFDYQIKQT
jgi:hypothetical protein